MAVVHSAKHGSLETKDEIMPSENDKRQHIRIASLSNKKKIMSKGTGGQTDDRLGAELKPEAVDHADDVVCIAVPPILIKEENVEDENAEIEVDDGVNTSNEFRSTGQQDSLEKGDSVDGVWQFRCVDCDEAFVNKDEYLEHRRGHTHDGPIVCLDTDSQWDDLLVSVDGGRRTLCCALCGRKFSNSRGFFTHQLKHRNQTVKQVPITNANQGMMKQRLFECKDCGKTFSTVGQCLNHQRSHKQASKSVFHQIAHLKKKSFQCPTCGRCYSRASALDAHRRCHEVKLVKFRSSETERTQVNQETTTENEDVDSTANVMDENQQNLFECSCGKSFRTSCGLSAHQRFSFNCSERRVKEAPKQLFDCGECEKSFTSPIALACHQRWHRRRALLRSSGQPFKCEECGRVFTSLTFYHKHQRLAHSKEMPAKSFLHQVCQLQKKAFQCSDCGCRFSRASALQSHQLCHTDVYGEVMGASRALTPPAKLPLCNSEKANDFADRDRTASYSQISSPAQVSDVDLNNDENHEVIQENDTIDFDVEVVSVAASDESQSDNSPLQDQNPDLELVCESDQEEKEEFDFSLNQTVESPSSLHYKPEVDVKIVQINYDTFGAGTLAQPSIDKQEGTLREAKKYKCPECDRTFVKAGSLRCHRLWHRGGMGKKSRVKAKSEKGVHQVKPLEPNTTLGYKHPSFKASVTCEICGHESSSKAAYYFHLRKHEDRKPYKSIMYQLASLQKNNIKCEECGMRFSRVSALHSHQQHHKNVKKPFSCLQCGKSYSNSSGLSYHRRLCSGPNLKCENDAKLEPFNPKKTLLGPKVHHCKHCGKGFWSLGAFSHHKQYQSQCADVKERTSNVIGRVQCKKAPCPICGIMINRRGGSMASHMLSHQKAPKKTHEKHKCERCGKSYRFLACFLKHQVVHETQGLLPPIKSFDHQVEQVKKNAYSCPDCGKLFSRAMALQFHMKSHGYETGFPASRSSKSTPGDGPQCSTCLAHFISETMLQSHQKHCGKPNEEHRDSLDGDVENRMTESPEKVRKTDESEPTDTHKEIVSESTLQSSATVDLKYKCKDCNRSFAVVGALNFHKRIHRKSHHFKGKSNSNLADKNTMVKVSPQKEGTKAPFICTECGRRFSTNSALGTHRRWHTDKKFAGFLSKGSKSSLLKNSLNDGPFLCNLCGKGFFYLCVLRRHQMHHPPLEVQVEPKVNASVESDHDPQKSNLACPECGETFPGGSLLATHFASHHAKPPECAALLNKQNQSRLKEGQLHMKPTSSSSVSPGKKSKVNVELHQCPHCSKSFLNIRGLRAHKWQKHRKSKVPAAPLTEQFKPFPCTRCEKRYRSQGALYNHNKSCKVVRNEPSPQPVTDEADKPLLPRRPLKPTRKCLFKCQKCGKAFPSEDQLNAHKEVVKTRPHCCALCCRGYWTETQLQQHLAWHDEVRRRLPTELRYRLSASVSPGTSAKPQASAQQTTAKSPVTTKTPVSPVHPPPVQGHKCPHCGKAFLSPDALQQHQTVHKHEEPYHCPLCQRTFGEIRDLIDHHQDCLGDKEQSEINLAPSSRDIEELTCIECGMSFSQEMELHQHYIDHARGGL